MTKQNKIRTGQVSPTQFMRELRPEYYSDTEDRVNYFLETPTFEYHLDSITSRNQTLDFEIFCRKLCERTICPNLLITVVMNYISSSSGVCWSHRCLRIEKSLH